MALKTFVKISNVNNLSDARYCAGMYVDLMGFSLEETNENFITPAAFKEITDWLSGLSYVAEFDFYGPEKILETLREYEGFSYIQVTEELFLPILSHTGYQLMLKKTISSPEDLVAIKTLAKKLREHDVTLLLESHNIILLDDGILETLKIISKECDVLLAFGFDKENVEDILTASGIKGLALKGGKEIKPGVKDFDELADILETLEIAD